jgi:hypothetical protein
MTWENMSDLTTGWLISWFFPSVLPPWTFSLTEGDYDATKIDARLTGRGYQKVKYGNYTYYGKNEDFQIKPGDELAQTGIMAGFNRIAVLENQVITAPATEILTGILDTAAGETISLMDNPGGQALASSLGGILSGAIISPERVVAPAPGHHAEDWPRFDFARPAGLGNPAPV